MMHLEKAKAPLTLTGPRTVLLKTGKPQFFMTTLAPTVQNPDSSSRFLPAKLKRREKHRPTLGEGKC
ncbi:hypothetical protein I79_012277 [Cricetulus griseus]|uniref:Uncharacterized protein n=1 Tax=Cricetulus griseus TaxID=10029 RepID=G3HNE0_CRIGR|nr:hypothetical protein I79_012277 [Cricetulus griseus]